MIDIDFEARAELNATDIFSLHGGDGIRLGDTDRVLRMVRIAYLRGLRHGIEDGASLPRPVVPSVQLPDLPR